MTVKTVMKGVPLAAAYSMISSFTIIVVLYLYDYDPVGDSLQNRTREVFLTAIVSTDEILKIQSNVFGSVQYSATHDCFFQAQQNVELN